MHLSNQKKFVYLTNTHIYIARATSTVLIKMIYTFDVHDIITTLRILNPFIEYERLKLCINQRQCTKLVNLADEIVT